MKILNLYAGIGGNRKLWGDEHEITAVEYDKAIAKAYQDRYPSDTVIIGDAKQYLLDHYKEFDFIWVSPVCITHSRPRFAAIDVSNYDAVYPDMTLYQIIIFLKHHCKNSKWVVENVIPYYKPLIQPSLNIDRHFYWSNFNIRKIKIEKKQIHEKVRVNEFKDFDLSKYKDIKNKVQVIRNQVDYEVGKHILDCAMEKKLIVQTNLFAGVE